MTVEPGANSALQVDPQSIPIGSLITLPEPVPARLTATQTLPAAQLPEAASVGPARVTVAASDVAATRPAARRRMAREIVRAGVASRLDPGGMSKLLRTPLRAFFGRTREPRHLAVWRRLSATSWRNRTGQLLAPARQEPRLVWIEPPD